MLPPVFEKSPAVLPDIFVSVIVIDHEMGPSRSDDSLCGSVGFIYSRIKFGVSVALLVDAFDGIMQPMGQAL